MTKLNRSLLLLAVVLVFSACRQDSPEAVVRKWQTHVDQNEFREAMKISTPRTMQLLSWMEAILTEMDADTIIHTELTGLSCREEGDQAVCHYTIVDGGEVFPDSFVLTRMNGKWLVDIPEEPSFEDPGDLEELFERMAQDSLIQ